MESDIDTQHPNPIPPLPAATQLRLRAQAFGATANGIVITDARLPDNPIVDVNAAFEAITGYCAADVLGRNCRFLQGSATSPEARAALQIAIAAGRDVHLTILNYRKDGTPFWNDLSLSPVRDNSGVVTHFVGVQNDITARRRAEEHSALLAEIGGVLIGTRDPDEAMEIVSRLVVPPYADWCMVDLVETEDETRGPPRLRRVAIGNGNPNLVTRAWAIIDRLHSEAVPSATGRDALTALTTGQPVLRPDVTDADLEAEARSPEHLAFLRELGLTSWIVVQLRARGRGLGILWLCAGKESGRRYGPDDMAELQDLARLIGLAIDNAQLFKETNRAVHDRDRFLSIAAHELRTPIAGIKGYAQVLLRAQERGTLKPDRLTQSLRVIDRATSQLTALTADLIDVSRLRLGRLPLHLTPRDLAALVRHVVAQTSEATLAHHIIDVVAADTVLTVPLDEERIEQVVANLLHNAVKYTPGGGTIRITIEQSDLGVIVAVTDPGIGLPPGTAETIFHPFGRTETAIAAGIPGLGLGLYICRGITERHDGRIWAASPGPGQGTTITFWLPREESIQ